METDKKKLLIFFYINHLRKLGERVEVIRKFKNLEKIESKFKVQYW